MSPPKCGRGVIRTVRNSEKLLYKRCPLKHEARKRERGETRTCATENAAIGEPA